MASRLFAFPQPHLFRSPLVKHQPESIPSIDELEHLQSELKVALQRAMDRRQKAADDARIIEESIRRMSDKDNSKHERDYSRTLADADHVSLPSSSTLPLEDRKKRIREPGDSEGEPDQQRPRKLSPASSHTPKLHQ